MKVTRAFLARRLRYSSIEDDQQNAVSTVAGKRHVMRMHEFRILQRDRSQPCIKILFEISDGQHWLIHVAFGEFHDHFDGSDVEAENLEAALNFVEQMMRKEIGLLVTVDEQGRYKSGKVRPVTELRTAGPNQRLYLFDAGEQHA